MRLVQVDNLTVMYKNGNRSMCAVSNANFCVNEGDYFCIIGHNGSGKSTLVKAILGLQPFDGGEIKLNISRDKIGYMPQTSKIGSKFPATVKELVLSGTQRNRVFPFYTMRDRDNAVNAMKKLEIEHLAAKSVGELSGGQLQRALLARALSRKPRLLVLDEPCCGLDEAISDSLYTILTQLHKAGVTILMVTHDLEQMQAYATCVLQMDTVVKFCGSVDDWRAVK